MTRIVLVDDHPILRDGLRRLIEAVPGYEVVGEAGSVAQAVRTVMESSPDVLLLDLALPDGSGIDVLRELSRRPCSTKAVLLAAAAEKHEILEALLLGARGVVLKESATPHLFNCLRAVTGGEYWLGHSRMRDVILALQRYAEPPPPTPVGTLTPRELSIVAAVVGGSTNREVAEQLSISEQTVKNHMSSIFDKVGVSNRLELALFAIHHKLLGGRRAPASAPAETPVRAGLRLPPPDPRSDAEHE